MYTEWKVIVAETEAGSYIGSHASVFKFENSDNAIHYYNEVIKTAEQLKETHEIVDHPRIILATSEKIIQDCNPDNIELGMIGRWQTISDPYVLVEIEEE